MNTLKNIIGIIFGLLISCVAVAQNTTIQFVGKDRTGNDYVRLNHVSVFDEDQLWHEMLYYPDTSLFLGPVSVEDYAMQDFRLMQNVPNPFEGITDIALSLPDVRDVTLEIYDMLGKVLVKQSFPSLQEGTHLFRASMTSPQTYLLSATTKDGKTSIKMVNEGVAATNSIEYIGMTNPQGGLSLFLNESKGAGSYPFNIGDKMKYTGYALIDDEMRSSEVVQKKQYNNETIQLKFDVERPVVNTTATNNITAFTAVLNGNVVVDNNANVSSRGFCISTSQNPTLNDNYTSDGNGIGSFSHLISDLMPDVTYYVRAYAVNAIGISYGDNESFRTNDTLPVVVTAVPEQVTATSFVVGGEVLTASSATIAGVCWSTTSNPTITNDSIVLTSGLGVFAGNITGLICGTKYYVRAFATNSVGVAYGEEYCVTTLSSSLPNVELHNANIHNGLNLVTQAEVVTENCSAVTNRGVCWATLQNPTINNTHTIDGSGAGSFTSNITDLTAGATYYVRAYATNDMGTAYSEEISVTLPNFPTITTAVVSSITYSSATCGGNVSSDGGATVTARGVCWSTLQNPTVNDNHTTNGSGTGSFTSSITGLISGTTYYLRAYATNSVGTSYGEQRNFTTTVADGEPCFGVATVTDYDNNTYNTVKIGDQCWMKENLRTTHYSNGTSIALGNSTSTTTAYRYYPNNNSSNISTYGYLYNWKAVMGTSSSSSANPSGVQGICPTGWHVPSDAEWTQLTDYVGSQTQYQCNSSSSNIAKALAFTTGWNSSTNTCAVGNNLITNNATGFSALPAGNYNGYYGNFDNNAYFWSATEYNITYAYYRYLYHSNAFVGRHNYHKYNGFSVRCVRD